MLNFLPSKARNEITRVPLKLNEVRIRRNLPVTAIYAADYGIRKIVYNDLVFSEKDIEDCIFRLCDYSIFGAEESIKNGFITSEEGERVGICGSIVNDGTGIATIKDFSSMVIRIPNDIENCSESFISQYLKVPADCLVVSKPYHGKTTFIRDLGRAYSDKFGLNTLFVDERDELSIGGHEYLGKNSDVIRFGKKADSIRYGIRSINPQAIVCDEIMTVSDADAVSFAAKCGVKIIASAHGDSMENILKRQEINAIIKCFTFDYILFLNEFEVTEVYNRNLVKL